MTLGESVPIIALNGVVREIEFKIILYNMMIDMIMEQ